MCTTHTTEPAAERGRAGASGRRGSRRRKLWELEEHFHCSVIGTCLTLEELRHACRKARISFHSPPTDHELHSAFVNIAGKAVFATRLLQKQLDAKYHPWIRHLQQARDPGQLAALWDEALDSGEVAGAFWALVTHGAASPELLARVYGEIHMLSHLAGASTRVDLQELVALRQRVKDLERERAREAQQHRQRQQAMHAEIRALAGRARTAQEALRIAEQRLAGRQDEDDLRRRLQALSAQLTRTRAEQAQAEHDGRKWKRLSKRVEARNQRLNHSLAEARRERDALESSLAALLAGDCNGNCIGGDGHCPNPDLCGRNILYVGGRAGQSAHFRLLVERANGHFIHHDGGREDGHHHLAAILPQADAVLCPLDCISHSAVQRVKRFCKRHRKTLVLLPRSSLSAFSRGLSEVAA